MTLRFLVYYMDGRTAKSLPLPDLALQPGQAQELPIGDLMRKQPQIQDINLSYSYGGYWGDILARIGSTDRTGNFPVVPATAYKGGPRMSHYGYLRYRNRATAVLYCWELKAGFLNTA